MARACRRRPGGSLKWASPTIPAEIPAYTNVVYCGIDLEREWFRSRGDRIPFVGVGNSSSCANQDLRESLPLGFRESVRKLQRLVDCVPHFRAERTNYL